MHPEFIHQPEPSSQVNGDFPCLSVHIDNDHEVLYKRESEENNELETVVDKEGKSTGNCLSAAKDFFCETCDYKVSLDVPLRRLMHRSHVRLKRHVCNVCDKRSYVAVNMNDHKAKNHLAITQVLEYDVTNSSTELNNFQWRSQNSLPFITKRRVLWDPGGCVCLTSSSFSAVTDCVLVREPLSIYSDSTEGCRDRGGDQYKNRRH